MTQMTRNLIKITEALFQLEGLLLLLLQTIILNKITKVPT